jgi:hypothetical protein
VSGDDCQVPTHYRPIRECRQIPVPHLTVEGDRVPGAAATGRVIRARVLVRGWRVLVELNP